LNCRHLNCRDLCFRALGNRQNTPRNDVVVDILARAAVLHRTSATPCSHHCKHQNIGSKSLGAFDRGNNHFGEPALQDRALNTLRRPCNECASSQCSLVCFAVLHVANGVKHKRDTESLLCFYIGGERGIVRGCAAHPLLTLGTVGARARRRPAPPLRGGSSNPIIHVRGFESLGTSIGRPRIIRGNSSKILAEREGFEPSKGF
jgi:hypothetical protein